MNSLILKFEADDDGTGELFAEVTSNGFSGNGSAWFDKTNLLGIIGRLNEYPIKSENYPIIEGGYWGSSQSESKLKEEHLYISFYPIDSRGNLGVRVRLVGERYSETRKESIHRVAVELMTTYEEVSKFAKRFRNLIEGKESKVVLNEAKI
jgi:hypothetical protein